MANVSDEAASMAGDTLRAALTELSMPTAGECLRCWVRRATLTFGCDGTLRWTKLWSGRRSEPWSRRRKWMHAHQAPCDCEAVIHAFGERFCTEHLTELAEANCPDCVSA